MNRIFLLVPDLFPGDGVGNDVLGMASALRATGATVVEVCNRSHATVPSVSPRAFHELAPSSDDLLIYHYAVEWAEGDAIFNGFTGARILRFHNVTPPDLLRRWNRGIADFCARGRDRVQGLRPPFLLLSDSLANQAEFLSLGGRAAMLRVMPPFHRAEEIAHAAPDEPMMATLARTGHPRLLHVGRISPHKNVAALITDLDSALVHVEPQGQQQTTATSKGGWPWSWFSAASRSTVPAGAVLYVVGSFSDAFASYNRLVRRNARLAAHLHVIFMQDLTEASLAALYRSCDLFVTSSLHEGFCVPVIEAMACGLPLLIPDAPVFHETAGAHAQFFSRLSAREVNLAMEAGRSPGAKQRAAEFFAANYARSRLQSRLKEAIAASRKIHEMHR